MELSNQEFMLSVAHELRQPIQGANVICELIKLKMKRGEDINQEISNLQACLEKLNIFSNGLSYLYLEKNRGDITVEGISEARSIPQMIQQLVHLFEQSYRDKKLTFRTNFSEDIKVQFLPIDLNHLQLICFNILDNAVKYSYSNTEIRSEVSSSSSNAGIIIEVTNKGIQITDEDIKNCSKPGWRGRIVAATFPASSGLGLTIVSEILRSINGWFQLSQHQNNTVATVFIPSKQRRKQ